MERSTKTQIISLKVTCRKNVSQSGTHVVVPFEMVKAGLH